MPHPPEVPDRSSTLVSWLLLLLCVLDTARAVCPTGNIGQHCKYRCRCLNPGCDSTGECLPNAKCWNGYFGPQCQYLNAVNVSSSADWAHDNNHTSCNPSTTAGDVRVETIDTTLLTWLRLHVQNPTSIGNLSNAINVKLNGTNECLNKRVYTVLPEVLDVSCDNNALISHIVISGSITPHICTVIISGGRNVAFNQETNVVGTSRNFSTTRPVDDNYYCQVAFPEVATHVFIKIDHEQILYKIKFVLSGFTRHDVSITTSLGSTVVASHTESNVAQRITDIFLNSFKPFDSIHVQVNPQVEFCELEAIGESWCNLTHYGIDCQHACQCSPNQVCFPPTGMCGPECPPGAYGYLCSLKCSRGCLNNKCNYTSGSCTCSPGFMAGTCDTECLQGTYGTNCSANCSTHCKDPAGCNRASGNCSECKDGYFGSRCDSQCPANCLNKVCSNVTGVCHGCVGGYLGPNCTSQCSDGCLDSECNVTTGSCFECKPSRFGQRACRASECQGSVLICAGTCSEGCLNKTCHMTTGVCFACAPGFQEPLCLAVMEESDLMWVLLLIIPLILLCIVLVCCFARRRRLAGAEEKHAEGISSPKSSWTFATSYVTISVIEPGRKSEDMGTQVD